MSRGSLCWWLFACGVLLCHFSAFAGSDTPPTPPAAGAYVADPEIEDLIERTSDKDTAVSKAALEKLISLGSAAERQLQHHLQNDTGPVRVKYAELLSKCGKTRVGYRVSVELQSDGSGTLTLWSDRSLLAECGRHFDRLMGQPERSYTEDDLRQNLYSKVELIKYMDEGMKHLEARVDSPGGKSIETIGLLSFKSFESLANFANGFDTGGFYMLAGATLYDSEPGVRTYRFHKGRENNRDLYSKNLLLFYNIRWDFVLDVKGKVLKSNAMKTEGTKLMWSFDICQMLRGEAQIEVSFDSSGLAPRAAPAEDTAVALPQQVGNQPVAIPAKKLIHARACKKSGTWQELVEHNQLVELDARNSIGHGPLQYHWSQTSGPDLALTPEALSKDRIGMRIPEAGEYRFELTVSANGVYSKPVEVVVQVEDDPADKPPEQPKTAETPKSDPRKNDLASSPAPASARTNDANPPKTEQPKSDAPKTEAPKVTEAPKAPETKPDPAKSKEYFEQGLKLMKAGSYKEAKQALSDALAGNPQDQQIAFNLGVALFELGDFPQAVLKFEEVAGNSDNPYAMMYVGHCNARGGAMDEAREWYRRGTAIGKQKVQWEIMWNYGAALLATKDYASALTSLQSAETQARDAKISDYRLHRDLAIALHGTQQDAEALKHLTALQELGYTPDATLLAEVKKAAGKSEPPSIADAPKKTDEPAITQPPKEVKPDTLRTETAKVDPPKTQPAKSDPPKTDVAKKEDPPVAVKNPDSPPAKVEPPKSDPPKKVAVADPPARPQPRTDPAVKPQPKNDQPPGPELPKAPPPREPKPKKDPRPTYPKRALPPIPKDFDGALAAGKRAFQEALGHAALKTEEDKIKAAQSFDEAEAMYRAAWAIKPGDEQLINAFRDLSEYVGAIALVKNTTVQSKVRGLVVLDGEASIGPKDKPLYCVWEQTGGDDLALRPEMLADKKVSFKVRKPGIYKFELAVSDGVRGGNPVTVTVEVEE